MPKQLNCSTCAAPLDPKTGALTTECPYCGNTLVMPETVQSRDARGAHISFHVAHNQRKRSNAGVWIAGVVIGIVVIAGLVVALGGLAAYRALSSRPGPAG